MYISNGALIIRLIISLQIPGPSTRKPESIISHNKGPVHSITIARVLLRSSGNTGKISISIIHIINIYSMGTDNQATHITANNRPINRKPESIISHTQGPVHSITIARVLLRSSGNTGKISIQIH